MSNRRSRSRSLGTNYKRQSEAGLNLHLTKVYGISPKFNENALSFKDLFALPDAGGRIEEIWLFNYMIDADWVLFELPEHCQSVQITFVCNEGSITGQSLKSPNVKVIQVRPVFPFGTHHSKIAIIRLSDSLRIAIVTANFIPQDWRQKTQGIWLSPYLPYVARGNAKDSPTGFRESFVQYLNEYREKKVCQVADIVVQYDFSSIKVYLVASVPGRRTGKSIPLFGLPRMESVLNRALKEQPCPTEAGEYELIAQFSSIGSLGVSCDSWLGSQFFKMMSCGLNSVNLRLVFPTVDNVRNSLEGYEAGASIPYSKQNNEKQQYLMPFFRQWKSSFNGRSQAAPHVKSYTLISKVRRGSYRSHWFLLTSANLSKAAWGTYERDGTQYFIRSYEIGVLLIPQLFHVDHFEVGFQPNKLTLPYDLPLVSYESSDKPWTWDDVHLVPDRNGAVWNP